MRRIFGHRRGIARRWLLIVALATATACFFIGWLGAGHVCIDSRSQSADPVELRTIETSIPERKIVPAWGRISLSAGDTGDYLDSSVRLFSANPVRGDAIRRTPGPRDPTAARYSKIDDLDAPRARAGKAMPAPVSPISEPAAQHDGRRKRPHAPEPSAQLHRGARPSET